VITALARNVVQCVSKKAVAYTTTGTSAETVYVRGANGVVDEAAGAGKYKGIANTGITKSQKYVYDSKVERYRNTQSGRFVSQRDISYPPNRGFTKSTKGFIQKGTIIDRYGAPSGRYAGQPGNTISERGLPIGTESIEYHKYEVLRPVEAEIGRASAVPDFGASGGGTQYYFEKSIKQLIREGFLKEI